MNDYIEHVGNRRDDELRLTLKLGTGLAAQTAALRAKILASMERAVMVDVASAQAKLSPHVARLRNSSEEVRRELLAAGAELES